MSDLVDSDSSQLSEPLISRRSSGRRQRRHTNDRIQVVQVARGQSHNSSGGLRKSSQVPSRSTQHPLRESTIDRVTSRSRARHPQRGPPHDPPVRIVFEPLPQDRPRRPPFGPENPPGTEIRSNSERKTESTPDDAFAAYNHSPPQFRSPNANNNYE
jgi:hypothetical protein